MSDEVHVVLLATQWRSRALIRAQLIEEGFEVLAVDTWPAMRRALRPGSKPLLAIVDLQGLPAPDRVLNDLKLLMKPERVLVLGAIGTVAPEHVEALGFEVVRRPFDIGCLVAAAVRMTNGPSFSNGESRISPQSAQRSQSDS